MSIMENIGGVGIRYIPLPPMTDHTNLDPYPTIDPNGSVPEVYNYVSNVLFGTREQIAARDSLATLNPADPNIVGYSNDVFSYDNVNLPIKAAVMSDGSRWFDVSGDGNFETHIKNIGGALYYDSDLNGTFDTLF